MARDGEVGAVEESTGIHAIVIAPLWDEQA